MTSSASKPSRPVNSHHDAAEARDERRQHGRDAAARERPPPGAGAAARRAPGEDQRQDHPAGPARRLRSSSAVASLPPTWVSSRPPARREAAARSAARRSRGRSASTASTWVIPPPSCDDMRGPTPSARHRREHGVGVVAGEHPVGSEVPEGNDSASRAAPRSPRGCQELVGLVEPEAQPEQPGRQGEDQHQGAATKPRAGARPGRRSRRQTECGLDHRYVALVRHPRPEDPAAEQHQRGRQHGARTRAATTTPIAQASPSPRVVGIRESSRVSRPSTTVAALASTASAVRRTATAIASCRDRAAQLVR